MHVIVIFSRDHMRLLCNDYLSSYASLISLHLPIYIGGDSLLYVYCIQTQTLLYAYIKGDPTMLNSLHGISNLYILLSCSNHIVINSPKRGRLKVHLLLNGVLVL